MFSEESIRTKPIDKPDSKGKRSNVDDDQMKHQSLPKQVVKIQLFFDTCNIYLFW